MFQKERNNIRGGNRAKGSNSKNGILIVLFGQTEQEKQHMPLPPIPFCPFLSCIFLLKAPFHSFIIIILINRLPKRNSKINVNTILCHLNHPPKKKNSLFKLHTNRFQISCASRTLNAESLLYFIKTRIMQVQHTRNVTIIISAVFVRLQ